MKLTGKVALITGGATGIGKAVAQLFAKEGAKVVINYYGTEEQAIVLQKELAASGAEAVCIQADVSKEEQVKEMVNQVIEKYGKIDILVCSAGIDQKISFEEMTVKDFDRIIGVDLRGVFLCNHEVIPYMLKNNYGRIINITSQLGQLGGVNTAHYSAAKAGVIGLTKSLAREFSARGITANCVAPGPVETEMFLKSCPKEWQEKKLGGLPIKRIGKPEEVAPAVLLLASDPDGSFFTGQTLGPNGGDVML